MAKENVRHIDVQRWSVVSHRPFDTVVRDLSAALGHPDGRELETSLRESATYAGYEREIASMVGRSGFMEMLKLDIGSVLRKAAGSTGPRSWRYIVGNPVIMQRMVSTVPDAASYAPVTILVDEREDGVHLSYDRVASFIAPYAGAAGLRVAAALDEKVEKLLSAIADSAPNLEDR